MFWVMVANLTTSLYLKNLKATMIQKTLIDRDDIVLSIHKSLGNDYVIHLTDKLIDEPYDTMAYVLELDDIDEIIKQLKEVKKLIQSENDRI